VASFLPKYFGTEKTEWSPPLIKQLGCKDRLVPKVFGCQWTCIYCFLIILFLL
jgi:DNA repair photolyase